MEPAKLDKREQKLADFEKKLTAKIIKREQEIAEKPNAWLTMEESIRDLKKDL